MKKDYRN